ncbi:HET-domain-containing protein [Xylariaceae sp. FL0594]|nr:HET-domain-containing protein [Xylariaceae sp. FL0594]
MDSLPPDPDQESVSADDEAEGNDYRTLEYVRFQIDSRAVLNHERIRFIPETSIPELISAIDPASLLPDPSNEILTEFVLSKARKVFLITLKALANHSKEELVQAVRNFMQQGFSDAVLPIPNLEEEGICRHRNIDFSRRPQALTCKHAPHLRVFHQKPWSRQTVADFWRLQWSFRAPVFSPDNFEEYKEELPWETVLPITWKARKARGGHFSNVYQAKIHASHLVGFGYHPDRKGDITVALKILKPTFDPDGKPEYSVEKVWKNETDTLNELSELDDTTHLIRRLAAFKWKTDHYIVFEWADGGSLREFWETNSANQYTLENTRIFLRELCGVAKGLLDMHKTNTRTATALVSTSQPSARRPFRRPSNTDVPAINPPEGDYGNGSNYRHGDLKPDNILVCGSGDDTWLGTLKIADLGIAKKHVQVTEVRPDATRTMHTTLHYQAPEAVANPGNRARSRRYDIWSMGCIIFESVLWLLYGYKAVTSFWDEKQPFKGAGDYGAGNHANTSSHYFKTEAKISENGGRPTRAYVSDIVLHWIDQMLQNDPACKVDPIRDEGTAMGDLLRLVKERLLVVPVLPEDGTPESQCRADAEELLERLQYIRDRAEVDDDYTYRPGRGKIEHPKPIAPLSPNPKSLTVQDRNRHLEVPARRSYGSNQQDMLDTAWTLSEDKSMWEVLSKKGEIDGYGEAGQQDGLLCEVCIDVDFDKLGLVARTSLRFLRARAAFCASCGLILHQLGELNNLPADKEARLEIWRVGRGLALSSTSPPFLYICKLPAAGVESTWTTIPIGLPKLPTEPTPQYYGLLRRWLADCDANHPDCQTQKTEVPRSGSSTPTRLIDVGSKDSSLVRLVETKDAGLAKLGDRLRYIAVSHPWGDKNEHHHYSTRSSNIIQHRNGIDVGVLPATFRDAIQVTQELGIRYVWIDALCIIQDEVKDFNNEAQHMETVFSSAYCVIAATRAKGMSSGFLSTRPSRKVVKMQRRKEEAFYICEAIDDFQRDVIEGMLNQRGWVLQERALARRTIYFADNQTYWECGRGVRCETLTKMYNNQAAFLGDARFPKVATESPKGGRIRLYELLFKQYSRLQFSNAYDRPLAIAGLEQRLWTAFKTTGGYGIIDRFFGLSLLWLRDPEETPRMVPIQFSESPRRSVPSWSWMAYEGAITYMDPPFGGVDWENDEILSPFPKAAGHTSNPNLPQYIEAIARNFSFGTTPPPAVYDQPGGDLKGQKCVIVAREKLGRVKRQTQFYVLIIVPSSEQMAMASPGLYPLYKRAGVALLPSTSIDPSGPVLEVRIG